MLFWVRGFRGPDSRQVPEIEVGPDSRKCLHFSELSYHNSKYRHLTSSCVNILNTDNIKYGAKTVDDNRGLINCLKNTNAKALFAGVKRYLHVVLPTPPFPPTNIHLSDVWSMMFLTEFSRGSMSPSVSGVAILLVSFLDGFLLDLIYTTEVMQSYCAHCKITT